MRNKVAKQLRKIVGNASDKAYKQTQHSPKPFLNRKTSEDGTTSYITDYITPVTISLAENCGRAIYQTIKGNYSRIKQENRNGG